MIYWTRKTFSCGQNILISKIDNPTSCKKWQSWELDGVTPHDCPAKKKNNNNSSSDGSNEIMGANYNPNKEFHDQRGHQEQQVQAVTVDNGPSQIAELAKQVSDLKDTVNILIAQIQSLRSEVKKTK
jgi:hypothetical protein